MIVLDTWFEKVKIYFRKINEPVGGARNTIPSYPSVTASHRAAAQFEWQVAGDWILRLRHVFKTPTWIQQNRHLLAVCHFNFIMSAGTEFRDKISGGGGGGWRPTAINKTQSGTPNLSNSAFTHSKLLTWKTGDSVGMRRAVPIGPRTQLHPCKSPKAHKWKGVSDECRQTLSSHSTTGVLISP